VTFMADASTHDLTLALLILVLVVHHPRTGQRPAPLIPRV
jgi:hypothetical protein